MAGRAIRCRGPCHRRAAWPENHRVVGTRLGAARAGGRARERRRGAAVAEDIDHRPPGAHSRSDADDLGRHRSDPRRRGPRHAHRRHLRPDPPVAQRTVGARRHHHLARRRLPVPSSSPLHARSDVPARHRGARSTGRGRAPARRRMIAALARLRVTLGFACGALVLWLAEPTGTTIAAGTAIAIAGEGLRVWSSGHLNKAREVTVSGPYRWFAHPLYVGSSVMGVGLAVASNSVAVGGVIALYLAVTLTAAIRNEEAFLRRTFGDRYDRYRRGRPGVDAVAADAHRRFSLAQATANREHRALVGLAVGVLLLVLKATYNGLF